MLENRAERLRGGFARFFCLGTEDDCGGGDLVFCEELCIFVIRRQEQKKNGYEDDSGIYSTVEGI